MTEALDIFGDPVTDPEQSRVTLWWGKALCGEGWVATDPSGTTFLIHPVYLPNSVDRRWIIAWTDAPYFSASHSLYDTAHDAMNMVDLHLAHES